MREKETVRKLAVNFCTLEIACAKEKGKGKTTFVKWYLFSIYC